MPRKLVVALEDYPGALRKVFKVLQVIADEEVNIIDICSMPIIGHPTERAFCIELEDHPNFNTMVSLLLPQVCNDVIEVTEWPLLIETDLLGNLNLINMDTPVEA